MQTTLDWWLFLTGGSAHAPSPGPGPGPEPGPSVPYPGDQWPTASPAEMHMDAGKLDHIPEHIMGDAVVVRHGHAVRRWGSASHVVTGWASVCRTTCATLGWGVVLQRFPETGGLAALDRPVRELPSRAAKTLSEDIWLRHLVGYTSQAHPPGSSWSYSCGRHWPLQHQILTELVGEPIATYLQRQVYPLVGGDLSTDEASDGTCRVIGSPNDLARLGYLWLHGGRWEDTQVIDPEFIRRSVEKSGPKQTEGWQIHLVHDGIHSEGDMPGVPDDCYFAYGSTDKAVVAIVPSLDLIVSRYRSHGYPVETFLGDICQACY